MNEKTIIIRRKDDITYEAEELWFDYPELLDPSRFFTPAEIFTKFHTVV